LSSSGRRRIHLNAYRSPGLITTRHSLDGVEFVASLVRHDPGLVQLWWPEWLIPPYDWGVKPDHLVIIDTGDASALILIEVDESTERPPVIRDRLRVYAKLFENHQVGWHLLWVANSRERLARLRQIAGPTKDAMLSGRCWGVAIDDVSDRGADAEVVAGSRPTPRHGGATTRSARPPGSASWRMVGNRIWIGSGTASNVSLSKRWRWRIRARHRSSRRLSGIPSNGSKQPLILPGRTLWGLPHRGPRLPVRLGSRT
jgi:hypothetical protein